MKLRSPQGMRTPFALCLALLTLAACKDETISGFVGTEAVWRLTEMGGTSFTARIVIGFPEEGKITGRGPCNRFSAGQSAPYPWFEAGPIRSTKMACPELAEETAFFAALARVTLVEVAGDVLILSDESGFQMVFSADP